MPMGLLRRREREQWCCGKSSVSLREGIAATNGLEFRQVRGPWARRVDGFAPNASARSGRGPMIMLEQSAEPG